MSFTNESIQELSDMDRNGLVSLLLEKDKQIQDLERLVEDQKRLRLQDSSQVEEKAAKIKEWVTKKLKELENRNKQLRDQNKKQKEVVESLNMKIASMSPISSPRRQIMQTNSSSTNDQVQYIDQNITSSIIDTLDVNQSLKTRRPQLKHRIQLQHQHLSNNNIYITSEVENNQDKLCIRLDNPSPSRAIVNNRFGQDNISINSNRIISRNTGISFVSIGQNQGSFDSLRSHSRFCNQQASGKESPLYDTVNFDATIQSRSIGSLPAQSNNQLNKFAQNNNNHYDQSTMEPAPPPLPLHQSDKWEQQLYDLAERTFSSLTDELEASCQAVSNRQQDRFKDCSSISHQLDRKSTAYLKESIKSFAKPSLTTIDGDEVVDDEIQSEDENAISQQDEQVDSHNQNGNRNSSNDCQLNRSKNNGPCDYSTINRRRSEENSTEKNNNLCQNLFSPMRSRSNKDSILRTQSVKKNPAPEKLYDFIATDLIKRGYLIKHGALRSHQRWFVLKNFHLYCFKRESDETDKLNPSMVLKLEPQFTLQTLGHNNDGYAFKINYCEKQSLTLIAETAHVREDWIRLLTVAINMSDIEPDSLTKQNSVHEGILTITKQGHSKKCHAILVCHLVFFLKSPIDPTPFGYVSLKGSTIREVTDNQDYNVLEQEPNGEQRANQLQDCSLAIYPRYSLNLDPIYITLGNQQETDEWFYQLSIVSGVDQASGTKFERILTQLMLNTNVNRKRQMSFGGTGDVLPDSGGGCMWRENSILLYNDKPITEPLTSLPNESLKSEAVELFKSILLFTQVLIEPVAIDYHVCLLQNCLGRLLKHPELRNEFYAQLVKQSTFVRHRCFGSKLSSSSSSSGCSSMNQRASINSLSPSTSDCQVVTDLQLLDSVPNDRELKYETRSTMSQSQSHRDRLDNSPQPEEASPPSRGELLQVMQIIALAVSLDLPRGRMRWWLVYHLQKFASPETDIGKYALFAIKAIDRTLANGSRDNVPSRTEMMSILLRNPYDHSTPHSLPVNFLDNSYMIVGTDGSTTVEEFMASMSKQVNIRSSQLSDFYLFANDANESKNTLHILEPQRKILDVVGWWEQTFKQQNSGRYQNTRVIKIYCKKRLVLRREEGETEQERLLVVHQLNNEIVSENMPITEALVLELSAIMAQLTFGDYSKSGDDINMSRCLLEKIETKFLPHSTDAGRRKELAGQVLDRWRTLSGRTAQDCVRVYLNCIRKLKL